MESIGTPALWGGFTIFVLLMLVIDLGVFHRKEHAVSMKEAAGWSIVWITLSLIFNAGVYHWFGPERGLEFLTGYLIEKALSVDNLFVFLVLFSYFSVPARYQHRVLFWGILGALVMRAVFIGLGAALLQSFHWIIYVFGVFLIFTGIKLMFQKGEEVHPERNPVLRLFKKFIPLANRYEGKHFLVKLDGKWHATPLLMVLVVVEATDVVFAVDSIPAIFAITRDPFIVYTSNIFAILGLRALYFLLAGMLGKFEYLNIGLALVLIFVGGKMLIASFYEVPIGLSLGVVATLLVGSVVASLIHAPKKPPLPVHPPHGGERFPEEPPKS
jgi:tellurite resistance protein TerC